MGQSRLNMMNSEEVNLRCGTLYIGDYAHLNISSFAVVGIKLLAGKRW